MMNHKDLIVWQKSMELVTDIYIETRNFPADERYGIVSQMRRAAVSIPSNISEGYGRMNDKETVQFLRVALGSAVELETQILISKNLDFFQINKASELLRDIQAIVKMLNSLIKSFNFNS